MSDTESNLPEVPPQKDVPPQKRDKNFLLQVFLETWKESKWDSIIGEGIMGGIMAIFIGHIFGVFKDEELKGLIYLAVVSGFLSILGRFLYRMVLVGLKKSYQSIILPNKIASFFITILICICVSLTTALVGKGIKKNKPEANSLTALAIEKPLPIPTIPTNEFAPADISAEKPTNSVPVPKVSPLDQFETFGDAKGDTDNLESYLHNVQSKATAQKQADALNEKRWWNLEQPIYKHSLTELSLELKTKADSLRDNIYPSINYSDCLPLDISPEIFAAEITKIRLKNDTNWDFLITISQNSLYRRRDLNISTAGCSLQIRVDDTSCGALLSIPPNDIPDEVVPIKNWQELVDKKIKYLVQAKELYLKQKHN